jgi:hypothetical protein
MHTLCLVENSALAITGNIFENKKAYWCNKHTGFIFNPHTNQRSIKIKVWHYENKHSGAIEERIHRFELTIFRFVGGGAWGDTHGRICKFLPSFGPRLNLDKDH